MYSDSALKVGGNLDSKWLIVCDIQPYAFALSIKRVQINVGNDP